MLWTDFALEMMNISLQFMIFPLFNYSITNFWRQEEERLARETTGSGVKQTTEKSEKKAEASTKDNNKTDEANDF